MRRNRPESPSADPVPGQARAFTLVEALIATVIVSMVALAGSTAVAVGMAIEQENRMSVLATQAAELQMGSVLEQSYDTMYTLAGTEAQGAMLGPKRPGASTRAALPEAFADLARTTTVTAENRNFTQYNNYTVTGMRIEVTVTGPDGSTLARLVRFRGKDPTS